MEELKQAMAGIKPNFKQGPQMPWTRVLPPAPNMGQFGMGAPAGNPMIPGQPQGAPLPMGMPQGMPQQAMGGPQIFNPQMNPGGQAMPGQAPMLPPQIGPLGFPPHSPAGPPQGVPPIGGRR